MIFWSKFLGEKKWDKFDILFCYYESQFLLSFLTIIPRIFGLCNMWHTFLFRNTLFIEFNCFLIKFLTNVTENTFAVLI